MPPLGGTAGLTSHEITWLSRVCKPHWLPITLVHFLGHMWCDHPVSMVGRTHVTVPFREPWEEMACLLALAPGITCIEPFRAPVLSVRWPSGRLRAALDMWPGGASFSHPGG